MPGRAPGPGVVLGLLERDGIGRFMDLRSFIDRGNHKPATAGLPCDTRRKCTLLAVRCWAHERKWPARPTDRTAGGRPDRFVASDRDRSAKRGQTMLGEGAVVGQAVLGGGQPSP